ncbi:MAG TPA: EamA family transporter RarD [Feifaniaceae bacterium]|nr:EamA family transporter RarD [Feifaniaceae bacterium]
MKERKIGIICTASCYAMWGLLPLYWHMLDGVDAAVILANRIVWSAVFTIALLFALKRFGDVKAVLRDRSKMRFVIPAAIMITINWGLYIWAVNAGHLLDASLGYYLNPLMVFAVGMLLFREKCGALDWIALALATVGVLVSTLAYGAFPWVALSLALSFGLYGTLKKLAGINGLTSIAVETILVAPFALAFLIFSPASHAAFAALTLKTGLLLLFTGVVTATPMILFTHGVNRLPFTTVGFLQYISPTLQLIIGTLIFHEALTRDRIVALVFFGAALILYSIGMARRAKAEKALAQGIS